MAAAGHLRPCGTLTARDASEGRTTEGEVVAAGLPQPTSSMSVKGGLARSAGLIEPGDAGQPGARRRPRNRRRRPVRREHRAGDGRVQRRVPHPQPGTRSVRGRRDDRRVRPDVHAHADRAGREPAWRLGNLVINALLLVTGMLVVLGIIFAEPITHAIAGAEFAAVPESWSSRPS